jgi:dTDP-4-dehydrorhamnose 3,5-epimerase
MIRTAKKDSQVISEEWRLLKETIHGVHIKEVLHVPRDHGVITEVFRPQWDSSGLPVVHIYQSRLFPGAIGAWSCHARTVDRLFVNQGHLKVVLYDGREDSSTHGMINEILVGDTRPALIVIPIGVWHGLQNLGTGDALVLNLPTQAYNYQDPDHWRLPYDTDEIPYKWASRGATTRLRADAK